MGDRLRSRIAGLFPPGLTRRYLVVGVANTLFAYATFAALTATLDSLVPASYLLASLVSSLLNITVSFLGYKWFVFRTSGHYLREWSRCVVVYSGSIAFGLACLEPTVFVVGRATGNPDAAPYLAGALLMVVQAAAGFLGHRQFSFRADAKDLAGPGADTRGGERGIR